MRIIIAGSRSFQDYILLKTTMDKLVKKIKAEITILSGGAYGADKLGELWARVNNYPIKLYLPDWEVGRKAGPLRNEEMAKNADGLVAFWDGRSEGTKDMIELAKKYKLKIKVILFEE